MKRLQLPILVCVLALTPAAARADDGGFWDWLLRMDTKFTGISVDFHLKCIDKDGKTIPRADCEHLEKRTLAFLKGEDLEGPAWETFKQEHNLRVSAYVRYGDSFPDSKGPALWAFKFEYLYVYHLTPWVSYGVGGGYLPIISWTDGVENRGVLTPASLTFSPKPGSSLQLRFDLNYLTGEYSAANVGRPNSTFVQGGEWNYIFSVGYDLRRLQKPRTPRP
jgi:hypothetical protein